MNTKTNGRKDLHLLCARAKHLVHHHIKETGDNDFAEMHMEFEKGFLFAAMVEMEWNQSAAALSLKMNRGTLRTKLKKHQLID